MPRKQSDSLEDILNEAKLVQSFVAGMDQVGFEQSKLVRRAVERSLAIIGEAMKNLDEPNRRALGEAAVPVRLAISMRNRLTHEYWNSDASVLWETVTEHMEPLIAAVGPLLLVRIEPKAEPADDPNAEAEDGEPLSA